MGRNNLENKSHDINWGYNQTKKMPFKFEILSEQQCRNFELSRGLEMFKLTMTIKVNAKHNITNNDQLEIKGKKYLVVQVASNFENPIQGRYKGKLDDFTGYSVIGLE